MQVRITKLRLALAASVCVLGGVGIATLLSPLVASALRNTGARLVALNEYSAAAPNTSCSPVRHRYLGYYDVPARDSIHANFETPLMLKPIGFGDAWCLAVSVLVPVSDNNYAVSLSVGGYEPSGLFFPSQRSTRPPQSGAAPRKR